MSSNYSAMYVVAVSAIEWLSEVKCTTTHIVHSMNYFMHSFDIRTEFVVHMCNSLQKVKSVNHCPTLILSSVQVRRG